eukprot:TRINITY_DN697_c0_g1_i2.p1 TRINITY_DN697_c0_g1~~TRINITY_DN697_c0_g1_i2.p1  ORF type:complete len:508 (+),score=118.71 TRINITY_DN697_c0_g1_i2:911-2434(+)
MATPLFEDVKSFVMQHLNECGIIYCTKREDCATIAASLAHSGASAEAYHAGLANTVRNDVLDKWSSGKVLIVVATIAFGMGIDKPDVRFVIHMNLPKTLEAFYQESGRAGRDGNPSVSVLYYSREDHSLARFLITKEKAEASEKQLQAALAGLESMTEYCLKPACRRKQLLAHFGEAYTPTSPAPCCDVCRDKDAVSLALHALENGGSSGVRRAPASPPLPRATNGDEYAFLEAGNLVDDASDPWDEENQQRQGVEEGDEDAGVTAGEVQRPVLHAGFRNAAEMWAELEKAEKAAEAPPVSTLHRLTGGGFTSASQLLRCSGGAPAAAGKRAPQAAAGPGPNMKRQRLAVAEQPSPRKCVLQFTCPIPQSPAQSPLRDEFRNLWLKKLQAALELNLKHSELNPSDVRSIASHVEADLQKDAGGDRTRYVAACERALADIGAATDSLEPFNSPHVRRTLADAAVTRQQRPQPQPQPQPQSQPQPQPQPRQSQAPKLDFVSALRGFVRK